LKYNKINCNLFNRDRVKPLGVVSSTQSGPSRMVHASIGRYSLIQLSKDLLPSLRINAHLQKRMTQQRLRFATIHLHYHHNHHWHIIIRINHHSRHYNHVVIVVLVVVVVLNPLSPPPTQCCQ